MPEASIITIKIYDFLGQEVKTLLSEERNAGAYNVTWNSDKNDGQKAASGTYIIRITVGSNTGIIKMILLK